MTTARFLARERIVLTGKSTDSSIMALSSGGLAVASDSDVEVDSPAKVPETADVDEPIAAAISQQASKSNPGLRSQRQAKPPAANPIAIDMDIEVLEADQESAEMPPAKLRAVENLSLAKRARNLSNSAEGGARRRKNEESEAPQRRKRQTSRSAASQGTAQPPAPVQAEDPATAATAQDAGAIKTEQAGRSEPPHQKQRAAAPGAASAAAGNAKLPKKTARKTAGTTQKAPSVKAKKEAAAAAATGSSGVIEKVLPQAELDASLAGLKRAEPHHELKHKPGKEPYRNFGIRVNEKPCASAEEVQMVKACQKKYWEVVQKTRRAEAARIAESNGRNEDGRKMSQRPDTKARKIMSDEGLCVNTKKAAGHVPGHPPSNRYFLRSEMGCLGVHFPPLTGIDYCTSKEIPSGCPEFAISIVNSGCYQDDDDKGEQLTYTGQGGCDLLGNKKQVSNQVMRAGNKALVGNIELGIPIRVVRKNKDAASEYGNIFIYDGLYDVVKYWSEKGVEGFDVFKYLMIRRPDQAELLSKSLAFGGTSAPKNHSIESRGKQVHVVSKDISNGLERIPVPAVNDVDEELPFPTAAEGSFAGASSSGNGRIRSIERGVSLPLLRYIVEYEIDENVPQPEPRVLPAMFKNNPHDYVKELNGGSMPYSKNKNNHFIVDCARAMIFECGPWTGCPDGIHCGYAVSQQGLQWRLEVFKTRFKGWGVRSWDTIPVGSYITTFVGRVHRIEDCDGSKDDTFYFDLGKRTDFGWDNKPIEEGHDMDQETKYYVDGGEIGGMSRYINHSCDPNLYVQPVLCDHADVDMPKICLFAAKNIPPFEELTYDYGSQYIRENLDGKCNCGAVGCQAPAE